MALLTPKGGRQILRLKIGDAPKCPFVGQDFTINVHLVDDSGQLKCGDEIPLIMKLCFQEKPLRPCPDNLIVIKNADKPDQDQKDFKISKTGSIRLTVRITELSMRFENKKLVLCASTENVNGLYVQSALSKPMLCIKYRLIVENNSLPEVWYKDEGGRDKCIELNISLRDHNNECIVERKVPLKVVLLYADGNTVLKQDILKISPDSKLHLDDKGKASLRLRIDDVSKNHQKQAFVIQISPDTVAHPLNNDISPDECAALEVRSKRNKSKRPREEDTHPPATVAGGNSAAQKIAIVNSRSVASKVVAPPAGISAALSSAPATQCIPPTQTVSRTVLEKTALENKRLNQLMSPFDSAQGPQGEAPSREQVGDAITALVEWSQGVIEAVATMQWHLIGNEKLTDGAVRPLFEMQNPNNRITELCNRYHDIAVPSLTLLYQNHFSHGAALNSAKKVPDASPTVVPGYIPLPQSSTGLPSFSGLPLTSPLNVEFPSPAGTVPSRSELFPTNSISKHFSTDSKISQGSAVTLGLPMPALPAAGRDSNIGRFSSTSSSVSNPSGGKRRAALRTTEHAMFAISCAALSCAPTTMPEFDCNSFSLSLLQDCQPMFMSNTTAEFLKEWSIDTANSAAAVNKAQSFSNVFYILAKRFHSKLVRNPLSCPAYDMNKGLVGFFVAKSDQSASNQMMEATSASFVSLEDYPANLFTPDEVAEANRIAHKLIEANANGVYSRSHYSDEGTFIEDAMIHLFNFSEDLNLSTS